MKSFVVSLAVGLAVLLAASAESASTKTTRLDRATVVQKLDHATDVVRFFENRGSWLRASRHEKCWGVAWQKSCRIARAVYADNLTTKASLKRSLWRYIPNSRDWNTSVQIVQRIYPGTAGRLYAISDHEGGSGPWVWWGGSCGNPPCLWHGYHIGYDSTGDTVGGPVQFRYSTFITYWPAALADARHRGFVIPDLGWARPSVKKGAGDGYGPWLSPLGQALTAAYMHFTGRQGCHWCGVP